MDERSAKSKNRESQKPNNSVIEYVKGVQFHSVEVFEFRRKLGDHPSTRHGPPISMGWRCLSMERMGIDEFEEKKSRYLVPRTFRLNTTERLLLLQGSGYQADEIENIQRIKRAQRHQRAYSRINSQRRIKRAATPKRTVHFESSSSQPIKVWKTLKIEVVG